ncbi:ABC transporter ATP-binding protein, partial [Candidatus Pacearchaeota archaeon]|nr:ABC transporter ATP-binding protein [Candidatus Pacearchaeota archaeon]
MAHNVKHTIELRNVAKHYFMGESVVKAVDGVTITIDEGDFVAIMGPSGSGKSTAMNLVGSLDLATSGDIYLDGIDIEHLQESELAQVRGQKIGFIFQSFNLIPNLTAKENIMLPMLFQGIPREEREERADELLSLVDLGNRGEHYPNQLSGGQQQRVAIARALSND